MESADNFSIVVPVDYRDHTPEKPFCWNETCPCHEDRDKIARVSQWITEGLMTPEQATDFVKGRGI